MFVSTKQRGVRIETVLRSFRWVWYFQSWKCWFRCEFDYRKHFVQRVQNFTVSFY